MARMLFGGGPEDVYLVPDAEGDLQAGSAAVVRFYSAETGGTAYTDLQDINANPIVQVITASGGSVDNRAPGAIAPFYGPDNVFEMWASANGSPRFLMQASNLGSVLSTLRTQFDAHRTTVTAHGTRLRDQLDVNGASFTSPAAGMALLFNATTQLWTAGFVPPFPVLNDDPPVLTDGMVWFRGDNDTLNIRRDGATERILTESYNNNGGGEGPSSPSQLLNLGAKPGQNHFNLGLGLSVPGQAVGTHIDVSVADLEKGYSRDNYFYFNADKSAVRFRVGVDGGRTTTNTQYPRVELKEYAEDGVTRMKFRADQGTHWMRGTTKLLHLAATKPWVVVAQVHDEASDSVKIMTRVDGGALRLLATVYTPVRTPYLLDTVAVGDEFSWEINFTDGVLTILINGVEKLRDETTFKTKTAVEQYFKAGAYAQSNVTTENGDATQYFEVELSKLAHWHTGWADPQGSYDEVRGKSPVLVPLLDATPSPLGGGMMWFDRAANRLRIRSATGTTENVVTQTVTDDGGGDDGGGGDGGPTKITDLITVKRWELTIPAGGDGGDPNNPIDIYAGGTPDLNTYTSDYFKLIKDSAGVSCVEFTSPVKGPGLTPTGSSKGLRSELREMATDNGGPSGPKASWSFTDNVEHDLIVTMTADPTAIVNGRKEIIVGQIHGAASSPIPIIMAVDFNAGAGKLQLFKNGTKTGAGDMLTNLTASTRFTYRIRKTAAGSASRMQVSAALGNKADLPATPQFDYPVSDFNDSALYFKAGCYHKTEITDTDASGVGRVRVYAMSLNGVGYIVPGTATGAPISGSPTTGAGSWVDLVLGTGVASRATMPSAAVRVEGAGTRAFLRGGLDFAGAVANGDVLATVPETARPDYTVTLPGRWTSGTAVLTVDATGAVKAAQSFTAGQWLTLDNVSWYLP